MFVLHRYRHDALDAPLENRPFDTGEITLGRDAGCDWVLDGADEALSRVHCTLKAQDGRLWLIDRSTNGVMLEDGSRAPRETPVELTAGARLRLGGSVIVCAQTGAAPPQTQAADSPRGESLLEAFCSGAKLDASAFAGENADELMERVGAIYRETVLGLAALMHDRAAFKTARGLDRTTIGAVDNNPFKWAATRRLAQDLLGGREAGFMADAQAVRASFEDLSHHIGALRKGAEAAAQIAVERLSPASIEAEARGQNALLRGRASVCWEVLNRRHSELANQDLSSGSFGQAFAGAYRRADG